MSLTLTYSALSDLSRRTMLATLAKNGRTSVSELAAPLSIGLPTVMKHLAVLERAGLVARQKRGRVVTVTLLPDAMAEASAWLDRTAAFWTDRIDRLVETLEEEDHDR